MTDKGLIPRSGGFRKLRSFQCAQTVYDGTAVFCDRFIDKRSRTHDQMVQAARSGVQNIAEGSLASATSKKTELKLTGVARASLGELLLDYEDYLRQHRLRQWDKDSPRALEVRNRWRRERSDGADRLDKADRSDKANRGSRTDGSDKLDGWDGSGEWDWRGQSAEEMANTMICLINQASYLLWQQMKTLEKEFLNGGGFTERMFRARTNARKEK